MKWNSNVLVVTNNLLEMLFVFQFRYSPINFFIFDQDFSIYLFHFFLYRFPVFLLSSSNYAPDEYIKWLENVPGAFQK